MFNIQVFSKKELEILIEKINFNKKNHTNDSKTKQKFLLKHLKLLVALTK